MRKVLAGLAIIALLITAAFVLSPWPSVLVIRKIFDSGAATASERLQPLVPSGLSVREGIAYDPDEKHPLLDIYAPAGAAPGSLPTIVWVHGGGFISGRRQDVANYAKILAGRGFAVVNIDYSIAPEAVYPRPIEETARALQFLTVNSSKLGIDSNRLLLAGDSAGAQIAAQVANLITSPAYAKAVGITAPIQPRQLKGVLLFCGPYDLDMFNNGWFSQTAAWSYSGTRDYRANKPFQLMSVAKYVTPAFPPAFITAGNGDPLGPQSVALAKALQAKGVRIETLFFAPDRQPPLGHEYQFDLRDPAAKEALERAVTFASNAAQ
jgi:acetyl esterase/lipase